MSRPEPFRKTTSFTNERPPSDALNAALRGATSAFARPTKSVALGHTTGQFDHGAVTAAASAGRGMQRAARPVAASPSYHAKRDTPLLSSGSSYDPNVNRDSLQVPNTITASASDSSPRARSPSNIAAALASARYVSSSQRKEIKPYTGPTEPLKSPAAEISGIKEQSGEYTTAKQRPKLAGFKDDRTETTSIAPTTKALMQIFEGSIVRNETSRAGLNIREEGEQSPAIKSPKPVRILKTNHSLITPESLFPMPQESDVEHDQNELHASKPRVLVRPKSALAPPTSMTTAPQAYRYTSSSSYVDSTVINIPNGEVSEAPSRLNSRNEISAGDQGHMIEDPYYGSAGRARRPTTSSTRPTTIHRAKRERLERRRVTPHMTDDSLANAIVGATLASSRVPSPSKSPAPRPTLPKRYSSVHLLLHRKHASRTPSPTKGLTRTTMRKEPSSDDGGIASRGLKHKGIFARKHPNKHHEGSRKRWRDQVTERERKRYEGLWAANKGLHIPFLPSELSFLARHDSTPEAAGKDLVSNLVVRDLWGRSRLPDHVLEEIWDLVDNDGKGRLGKEAFVVGLWLVDQRLKGRKLPVRVGESVWASVRGVKGVVVPRKLK